jgi:misacylated tRNA(Ala) deacylase
MSELLYFSDSYLRNFDAVVVEGDDERVVLDRTAFYPTGGGQPHDRGWLVAPGGARREVTDVRREGSRVWHTAPGHGLHPGDAVSGELDWERRYALMRTHTAMHVLSAVIWREHGAAVTGSSMEPLRGRMDFELAEMRADFARAVERAANDALRGDHPVEVAVLPRAEAERIPDLIRTKVNLLPAGIEMIRTVHIVGVDLQADGGTHVRRTGEVGAIRIVDARSKGKSFKRLVVAVTDA